MQVEGKIIAQNRNNGVAMKNMTTVYGWMSLALVLTAAVSFFIASTPQALDFIFSSNIVFIGLIIIELVAVGILASMLNRKRECSWEK